MSVGWGSRAGRAAAANAPYGAVAYRHRAFLDCGVLFARAYDFVDDCGAESQLYRLVEILACVVGCVAG